MHIVAVLIPVLFFVAIALSTFYVERQLRVLHGFVPSRSVQIGVACLGLLVTLMLGFTAVPAGRLAGVLYVYLGYVFTGYLYLFLGLLVFHLLRTVVRIPRKLGAYVSLAASPVLTVIGGMSAGQFSVNDYTIELDGLDREVSIAHISDVHLGHHRGREYLAEVVRRTNLVHPDFVVITGDLLDSNEALQPGVLDPLVDFAASTFYVAGNHEEYVGLDRAIDAVARTGVIVLRNTVTQVSGLQLVGLDYMKADDETFDLHPSSDPRSVKQALQTIALNPDQPSVLIQHSPAGYRYAEKAGVDLLLAGHTHAGQMFPGTVFANLVFPFNRGLGEYGRMKVFISQGLGTFLLRIRLGTSNELAMLKLVPKRADVARTQASRD